MSRLTGALLGASSTLTCCLVSARNSSDVWILLQICQSTCLGVNIHNLAGGLGVEVDELLSGRSSSGLLVVGGQTREEVVRLWGDAIRLVNAASLISGVVPKTVQLAIVRSLKVRNAI